MARRFAAVMTAAMLFGGATAAEARAIRAGQLPNTIGCAMCHVNPAGGGVRTPMGNDTLLALNGNNVDWPALCVLDADGDMISNGAELGDPNCGWRIGQPVPPVQSDPNDGDDPVEGGGAGGAGGGVGEPDRFCLEACETIATCAVDGARCPDLRPRDAADAAVLCARECVALPALPIAVERAAGCDEMVDFLNGASPAFAEACGVEPEQGEGGAGGEIEPECVPFCDRVLGCLAARECPTADAIDAWCPDACANQPALRVLADDADDCGDLRALLEASADGFAGLCAPVEDDAGPSPDGGITMDGGLVIDAGLGPDMQAPPVDAGVDARPIDAPDAQTADAEIVDAAPQDAAIDASLDAPAPLPATVEGCTQSTDGPAAWWLIGVLFWRRRR